MSEHYYTEKPTTGHDLGQVEEELRGRTYAFATDAGVFSKKGVDYGSKLMIETMEFPADARVLDVGCGYGPIGLAAAAMAGQGQVTMVDINERAIELAKRNAQRNSIRNVRILQSDLLAEVAGESFDVVLTNPPIRAGKETVHRIFEQAHSVLTDGGALWVVIQKKQGAPSAVAKLESIFASVEEVERDRGYWILKATK
ncbi:class I SAM-dependent methyltransferase [Paenibacillus mucilaginosus]|uniref:YbxB n=2 Tax=Paenibacillus mucilaginosus TaxID=61624 RepID=H6NS31_9BACL|nr:class I SAM-dependent methyltransferase [Paenibacillus mucilaginosus]AEI46026.1 YbxB [Paenibacillus mucilaginosus KNP414]AFC33660.1 YbxB [Paenibacillus mucilaginosus 3016]MCG7217702.1 class I SAM-dependent methyltransferase [Paenibacillus mucilaginosus]WDM27374.1 class I SAM-dependent methyltransferase [Paenibacillus mucilaginosus]WFA22062.1 class I SAM-dependent methyltransferase [Paenibacillus mucilaginosus]